MDWLSLFTSFEGRISRKPFWIALIVLSALELAASGLSMQFDSDRLGVILDLVLAYPEFAVAAKRAHDRNTPAWVIGVFFAVGVALDVLELAGLVNSDNMEQNGNAVVALLVLVGLFALILLVDLGFRRGTQGPNRFGPDPLEARA